MKKPLKCREYKPCKYKFDLKMKLSLLFLFFTIFAIQANFSYAQKTKVSLDLEKVTIGEVIDNIEGKTEFYFLFNTKDVDLSRKVSVKIEEQLIYNVLKELFEGTKTAFEIEDRKILLRKGSIKKLSNVKAIQESVTGTVTDENGTPLAGVNVVIKGSIIGTQTDFDGNYQIKVEEGDQLSFSYIGMEPQTVTVGEEKIINVVLRENESALDEVVVTAFGKEKKLNMISSVAKLNVAGNVDNKPITSLSQALQGGITGINVTQGSGQPGADAATITIRGRSTLNGAGSAALVLVDGVPMNMNDVDPNTIENISVLKDAAAAAIYGSRAANGVIVITTKRGTLGKVSVNYNTYSGFQKATYLPDFIDAAQYMEISNLARTNGGAAAPYTEEEIALTRSKSDLINHPNTNWLEEVWNNFAPTISHSLSVNGGNGLARFAITGSYLSQKGYIENLSSERFNFRINTNFDITKTIGLNVDLQTIRKESKEPGIRFGETDWLLNIVYRTPPNIFPKYTKDGQDFYGTFIDMNQPRAQLDRGGKTERLSDFMNVNVNANWDITPDFKIRSNYNYTVSTGTSKTIRDVYNYLNPEAPEEIFYTVERARGGTTNGRRSYIGLGLRGEYTYHDHNHRVFALAGYNQELTNIGVFTEQSLRSAFGKLNYTFRDKYLIEGTMRYDGSSKFALGKKFGVFPSVAAGWNLHNESFIKDLNFVNNFKLRASYGILGNQNIQDYQYQNLIAPNGNETVLGNPDITWEKVNMLNYGFDATVFKNLSLSFSIYDKLTTDALLVPSISYIGGTRFGNGTRLNAGEIRNTGWELDATYQGKIKDLSLNVHLGISQNDNIVEKLVRGPYINGSSITQEGYAFGSPYVYVANRLLQESDFEADGITPKAGVVIFDNQLPGDVKYEDVSGPDGEPDGLITDDDRITLDTNLPDFNYFSNFSFIYKNWDLDILLQGKHGSNAFYGRQHRMPLDLDANGTTPHKVYLDHWTPENTGAFYPRPTASPQFNNNASTYWRFNSSYLRVKYLQLGYSFNEQVLKPLGASRLRFYVNAQNPFTFTSQKIVDPEGSKGQNAYPLNKVFTFGMNVSF